MKPHIYRDLCENVRCWFYTCITASFTLSHVCALSTAPAAQPHSVFIISCSPSSERPWVHSWRGSRVLQLFKTFNEHSLFLCSQLPVGRALSLPVSLIPMRWCSCWPCSWGVSCCSPWGRSPVSGTAPGWGSWAGWPAAAAPWTPPARWCCLWPRTPGSCGSSPAPRWTARPCWTPVCPLGGRSCCRSPR